MLKNLLIACSITTALAAAPAYAQVYESFDSNSFLGSGLVGVNSQGVSLNTGNSAFDASANIGPGGINGSFGGNGFGGNFNQNGVSVGTDNGFGGTFGTGGGTFNGPGGINGSFNTSGGGNFNSSIVNSSYTSNGGTESPTTDANGSMSSGGGGAASLGGTGDQSHSSAATRGYQTQQTETFGRTLKNNQQSIVGRNLNLAPISAGNHWLAPVFGY